MLLNLLVNLYLKPKLANVKIRAKIRSEFGYNSGKKCGQLFVVVVAGQNMLSGIYEPACTPMQKKEENCGRAKKSTTPPPPPPPLSEVYRAGADSGKTCQKCVAPPKKKKSVPYTPMKPTLAFV